MSRLIVVSNRVQQLNKGSDANQGGLAVALLSALRQHGGIWFGWSGETPTRLPATSTSRAKGVPPLR